MFGISRSRSDVPRGPSGQRAYVVGGVHGRLDLLDQLLDQIHRDLDARRPSKALVIFLGDLIDRGPSSAQVIERLRTYRHDGVRPIFLLGNHEEVLIRLAGGESDLIPRWIPFGAARYPDNLTADPQAIDRALLHLALA